MLFVYARDHVTRMCVCVCVSHFVTHGEQVSLNGKLHVHIGTRNAINATATIAADRAPRVG